jgi:hypothetical protein
MGLSSRYWNMWRISPASDRHGYQSCTVSPAQEFFAKTFQHQTDLDTPTAVVSAQNKNYHAELIPHLQQSGLCLRCYASRPILNACCKIDSLFGGQKCFTGDESYCHM